jgi:hypothetical protein
MNKEFEIVVEGEYPGTPEQVWNAVTTGTDGWLFPTDGLVGEDLVVERPVHHINRTEGAYGWFNQLEQVIEDRPEGHSCAGYTVGSSATTGKPSTTVPASTPSFTCTPWPSTSSISPAGR